MKTKEIFILSQAKHNVYSKNHCIGIGDKISESPMGPGKLTGITDVGYPQINYVAVTWFITEDGYVYQNFPNQPRLFNKKDNSSFVCYYKHNDKWVLEGSGEFADAIYPTSYKEDLHWKVKIFDENEIHVLDGDNL